MITSCAPNEHIFFGDGQRSLPTAARTARQDGDEKRQPSWRPSE